MTSALSYKPAGEVSRDFLRDRETFAKCLRGPIGSGKSVTCVIDCIKTAMEQKPDEQGIRWSRGAVIRNTNPELKTTTIKTWLDWVPQAWGKLNMAPPFSHHLRVRLPDETTMDCEVLFLSMDRPQDVKKMLSLELTWAWINEAREIKKEHVDAVSMRIGRFPAERNASPTYPHFIMDTNAPSEDHWWPIMSGEVAAPEWLTEQERINLVLPDGWKFWTQPPAAMELKDTDGRIVSYDDNPKRENAYFERDDGDRGGLKFDYYRRLMSGKDKRWIDVYVMNRYGTLSDGKAIYPQFTAETHVLDREYVPGDQGEWVVGIDFGLTPAAVFCQLGYLGRWVIFDELLGVDMGAKQFGKLIRRRIEEWRNSTGLDPRIRFYGDPAGSGRAQTDATNPFQILRTVSIDAFPAPTNDPDIRIESVQELLQEMVDGKPRLVVSPSCKNLIQGFEGGYHYRRLQVSGVERYEERPNKNRFSHPHDALQYAVIGGGEGRRLTVGHNSPRTATVAKRAAGNPFSRRPSMHARRGVRAL